MAMATVLYAACTAKAQSTYLDEFLQRHRCDLLLATALPDLCPLLGEAACSTLFEIVRNRMHMSFAFPIEEK
jgi:hypothetical protein